MASSIVYDLGEANQNQGVLAKMDLEDEWSNLFGKLLNHYSIIIFL